MQTITEFLDTLFGLATSDLTIGHMVARTILIFILGIVLVRIGRKRFIGKLTAFDMILAITIGSLLSRAITMKDQFLEILASSIILVLLHRLFSFLASRFGWFGTLIKGTDTILLENGVIDRKALAKNDLSEQDLMQSIRLNAGVSEIHKIKVVRMERNGDMSVVLREDSEKR